MAAKVKKKDFICNKDTVDGISAMVGKAFSLKADIRVMKEQKDLVLKGVTEKLGDLSGISEYTERNLGNGIFITIRPPYTAGRFEEKVYAKYLEDMGLMDEAFKKGIYNEKTEIGTTLRFAPDWVEKTALSFTSFINYIADAELPDLTHTYLDLHQEIKKLEAEYKKTIDKILGEALEKLKEDLFQTRFVYDDGDIKGTLSFFLSEKKTVDIERAAEMLPSEMSEEEKSKILKSGKIVCERPVVNIVTEETIIKRREKAGSSVQEEIEEPSL